MPGRDGTGPIGEGAGSGRGAGPCTGYGRGYGGGGGRRMRNRFRASGGFRGYSEHAPTDRIETLQAEMETLRKQLADLDSKPPTDR